MSSFSVFRLALISLSRNSTRSLLTALGIVIAVASVITLVGLVDGARGSIQVEISKLGTNMIMVIPGSTAMGAQSMGMGSLTNLTLEDSEAILQQCPSVSIVTPWVRSAGQVVYMGQNWFTSIIGANENFPAIRSWDIQTGEYFTRNDNHSCAKVCVLGSFVAEKLFGMANPVGKTIRVRKMPFVVVGVLAPKGATGMGEDQDDRIIAPFFTVQRKILGITHVQMILASAVSEEKVDQAKAEVEELLRFLHGMNEDRNNDFMVNAQADIAEMANSTMRIIQLLLTCIALISLFVGGINVMNIMLVSVTERTREIGIRMAVGARRRDVLAQFLIEAVTLSLLGGILGIFLGISLMRMIIIQFTQWQVIISIPAILISVFASVVVGVFFGLFPAWKASRLDPIEALRFE